MFCDATKNLSIMIHDRDNAPLMIIISGMDAFHRTLRILYTKWNDRKTRNCGLFSSLGCKLIFLIDFDEREQIGYEEKRIKS